jgi:hypothetical protein
VDTTQRAAVLITEIGEGANLSYHTPENPQATLSGLPAELRLQIYSYLCDSCIIHVHRKRKRFTWTPCRSPSLATPLLCLHPKWSGMCDEEDRCTYKKDAPPEPIGFWALAASNKFIRNETQDFFLRKAVVSIHPQDLHPWLDHVSKTNPRQIDNLRRITLAGPNTYKNFSSIEFQTLRDRIPKLEGIGVQCQDASWRWSGSWPGGDISSDEWKKWNIVDYVKSFDPSITIALEAIVWRRMDSIYATSSMGQQIAIRIIRHGKLAEGGSGSGWTDTDVDFQYIRQEGPPRIYKKNARWCQWWRGEDTRGF